MGQLVKLFEPAEAATPPIALPAAGPSGREITYGFFTVARFLGVERRSENWKRSYVQALIDQEGFPPPLPMLHAGALSREIYPRKSQWPAVAVAAWFRRQSPAQAVAQIEDAEALEAAAAAGSRLDAAAEGLFS